MASKKSQGRLHTPSKDSSSKAQLSFLLNEEQNEQQHISIDMGLPSLSVRDASWKRQYSSSSHVNNQASRNSNPQGHSNHLMDIEYPEQGLLSMPVSSPIHSHVSSSLSIPEDQSIYSSGGPSAMDVSRSTKGDSAGNTNTVTSTDRRGVRKKRQRKFVCDTCGFGFYTNSDLQKHVNSVHLMLRPFDCKKCDKKFGERSNATKHFKSVHERQKNAECEICHKVFAFRDGLVRHVRLVHDNIRNFHCPFPGCGQSFKQSAHLKKHQQVHSKSRSTSNSSSSRTINAPGVYTNNNTTHRGQVVS